MEEATNDSQEFKSEYITFTIKRKPHCVVEYRAKAHPEFIKKTQKKALQSVTKEVSIPGFRKGRAPIHLIVKKFPTDLEREWKQMSAHAIFQECQKLSCITASFTYSQDLISCNIIKHSVEEGAEITYIFESDPIVPDIDLTTLELQEVKQEVIDEKKVEETIYSLQVLYAKWNKCLDREAQVGDYAYIDVEDIEQDPPEKCITNAFIRISKNSMAKWMFDLIVGMKAGDSKEGVSQVDEKASEEERANTPPKKIRLTLCKLNQAIFTEGDDFAKEMGEKNAQDLKDTITKLLQKQAEYDCKEKYLQQIYTYLLDTYPFDIPHSLLIPERDSRLNDLCNDPDTKEKMKNLDEKQYEKIKNQIEQEGKRALCLFFLSKKIVEEQKIPISSKDIPHGNRLLDLLLSSTAKKHMNTNLIKNNELAMTRLLIQKAGEYIISKAKIVPAKNDVEHNESKTLS